MDKTLGLLSELGEQVQFLNGLNQTYGEEADEMEKELALKRIEIEMESLIEILLELLAIYDEQVMQ